MSEVLTVHGPSPRALEILPLLCQPLTGREIAARLSISTRTVENHAAGILGKFGLASRRELRTFVEEHDPLRPPEPPDGDE